jgi:hypothetical protein
MPHLNIPASKHGPYGDDDHVDDGEEHDDDRLIDR